MTGQMIDPDQGLARRRRQPLGQHHARQDAADQARPCRDRDGVDGVQRQPGVVQHAAHNAIQPFGMGARGDFGNHAAESVVQGALTEHDRRQDLRAATLRHAQKRCGGVVATAFDSEDDRGPCHACSRNDCIGAVRQVTPDIAANNPGPR